MVPDALEPRGALPRFDPLAHRLFGSYAAFYLWRSFRALRVSRATRLPEVAGRPIVVYANHPSWWDPLVAIRLARRFFPDRRHYAPIDSAALDKYRFFARLGFFGIDRASRQGAVDFLTMGRRILAEPGTVIWLTPQGEFRDVRDRPLGFEPGIGHLARYAEGAVFQPLAIEYCYWEERLPNILLRWGAPVRIEGARTRRPAEWNAILEQELESAMDALAAQAQTRDTNGFEVIERGRTGIGGVYDLWRRLKAWSHGTAFHPEHGGERL